MLRGGFAALAVVALAALLLQPVCEAFEVDAGGPAGCCMSVDEAPPASVAAVLLLLESPPAVAIASGPRLRVARQPAYVAAPPGQLRACPPYHSRSARNLS